MITIRKKTGIAASIAAAILLLAIFNISAGAKKKTILKKQRGVTSVTAARQLALQPALNNTELTVKGIYGGGNTNAAILLKSPKADNEQEVSIACSFVPDISAQISDVPLQSEFVVSGNITWQQGTAVLSNCRLICINLPNLAAE